MDMGVKRLAEGYVNMKRMSRIPPSDAARAQELVAEVAKITAAVDAARALLDFNDEPARFDAFLDAAADAAGERP